MTILLIILVLLAIALFVTRALNASAYWMGFVLIGWFLTMSGLMLFFAKYGGFYYRVNIVLFFNDSIRNFLLNLPFSIEDISRLITIGRSIFIYSLLGLSFSLYYHKPFLKLWRIHAINAILPIANLVFYDSWIYKRALTVMQREYTYTIGWATRAWVILSAIIALTLIIQKYRRSTIPWVRQQDRFILLGLTSLILFYFYLGFLGPLQVFDAFTYYLLYSDFSNYNPPISLFGWYASIGFTTILTLVSTISIWRYTQVETNMGKVDLRLARKLKTANMGANVFTHAIKNQLLMVQILLEQAKSQTPAPVSPPDSSIGPLNQASDIVQSTLNRLDHLYRSFKTNQLQMRPVTVLKLLEPVLTRARILSDSLEIDNALPGDTTIIADDYHLSEALSNLLINALEAIDGLTGGSVKLQMYAEESWVVFRVIDNGPGIAPHLLDTIFDPFYTSKNTNKNWGVGLSYTKHVILGHYGRIHVNSRLGEGSVFQIVIPIYPLASQLEGGTI